MVGSRVYRLALGGLCWLCCVIPVNADTITYTKSLILPGGSQGSGANFNLPQFNSAIGFLEDVRIDAFASLTGMMTFTILAGDDEVDGCDCGVSLQGGNLAGDSLSAVVGVLASDLLAPGESGTVQWSAPVSGFFSVISTLPYIGTGQVGSISGPP
jgi:hypothetical protein